MSKGAPRPKRSGKRGQGGRKPGIKNGMASSKPGVFKIIPIDGKVLYNGCDQRTSREMYAETVVSQSVSKLTEGLKINSKLNKCSGFISMRRFGVCRGPYPKALTDEWVIRNALPNPHIHALTPIGFSIHSSALTVT